MFLYYNCIPFVYFRFAWQEDNYYLDEYRLLTIDKHHETCYYVILVKSVDDKSILLEIKSVTKWYLKEAFQNFHEISRRKFFFFLLKKISRVNNI